MNTEPLPEDEPRRTGPPPPPPHGFDPSALFVVLDGLRRVAPREVQGQLTDLIREFLLTLRSLIDWYLERLDRPRRVLAPARRELPDDPAGRGVVGLEGRAGLGLRPAAVDEVGARGRRGAGSGGRRDRGLGGHRSSYRELRGLAAPQAGRTNPPRAQSAPPIRERATPFGLPRVRGIVTPCTITPDRRPPRQARR